MSYTYTAGSPLPSAVNGFLSGEHWPTRWIISPAAVMAGGDPQEYGCPSLASTLIAFAITNVLVSAFGAIAGYRPVQHFVTCHRLGKPKSKNTIRYAWIFPLCAQFLANAIIGAVIHNTPGYEHIKVGDVVMIYLVRPRISLIFLLTLCTFFIIREEYMWRSALIGNAIAEILLQISADVYLVITAHGFYGGWSGIMKITIFLCVTTGLAAMGVALTLYTMRAQDALGGDLSATRYRGQRLSNSFGNRFCNWLAIVFFVGWSYALQWVWFIAFIWRNTDDPRLVYLSVPTFPRSSACVDRENL
jgi:hypothetical protein